MENDIKGRSTFHRFVSSLPIVGTALAILVEHTELGIAQYGTFLGLLRGAVIGLIIAVSLLAVSEGAIALFDVVRFWIKVNVTAKYEAKIGQEASDRAAEKLNESYYQRHPEERPGYKPRASGRHERAERAAIGEVETPRRDIPLKVVRVENPAAVEAGPPRISDLKTLPRDVAFVRITPAEFNTASTMADAAIAAELDLHALGIDDPNVAKILSSGTQYQVALGSAGNPIHVKNTVVIKTTDGRVGLILRDAIEHPVQ